MKDKKFSWKIGLLTIAFILSYTIQAQAASLLTGYTAWQQGVKSTDNVLKPWKINFNKAVIFDVGTISPYIFITDAENIRLGTDISISSDGKSATIYPQTLVTYQPGAEYRLYIGEGLSSQEGKNLARAVVMPFSVSTSGHIVDVDDSSISLGNTRYVTFALTASASVFASKVNGVSMDYQGSHIYKKTLTGLNVGNTVSIQVYDNKGNLLETQDYVIR